MVEDNGYNAGIDKEYSWLERVDNCIRSGSKNEGPSWSTFHSETGES